MFLLYYQQFVLSFQYIPYELSYDIQEMFKKLKPKMVLFKTFDEVSALLAAIQQERPEDPLSFMIKWCDKSMSEAEIRESAKEERLEQDSLSEEESDDDDSDSNMGEESDESILSDNDMDGKEEEEVEVDEMSMSSSSVSGSDLDDSDTEYSDSDESEDEVISFKQNLDHLKPSKEEEEDLEKEFQQLMQESLGAAKLAPKASNMSLPAANRAIINRFSQGSSTARERAHDERTEAAAANTIQFHVMIKKGTKAAVRDIQVPKAAVIAQANESRQAAEAQERDEIKRLVLQASERDEEAAGRQQRQPTKKYQVAFPRVKSRERWWKKCKITEIT